MHVFTTQSDKATVMIILWFDWALANLSLAFSLSQWQDGEWG